jgi:hypothetical protein
VKQSPISWIIGDLYQGIKQENREAVTYQLDNWGFLSGYKTREL